MPEPRGIGLWICKKLANITSFLRCNKRNMFVMTISICMVKEHNTRITSTTMSSFQSDHKKETNEWIDAANVYSSRLPTRRDTTKNGKWLLIRHMASSLRRNSPTNCSSKGTWTRAAVTDYGFSKGTWWRRSARRGWPAQRPSHPLVCGTKAGLAALCCAYAK